MENNSRKPLRIAAASRSGDEVRYMVTLKDGSLMCMNEELMRMYASGEWDPTSPEEQERGRRIREDFARVMKELDEIIGKYEKQGPAPDEIAAAANGEKPDP